MNPSRSCGSGLPDRSEGDVNVSTKRADWQKERLSDQTRELLDRDAGVFLHQSLSSPCLDALSGAMGSRLETPDGRTYLDFHGNSVHQVGYGHTKVIEAVKRQLDELPFSPRRFTNEPAVMLAEALTRRAGGDLSRVLFCPGGTEAVGMAIKTARVVTGRHKMVAMWDAFHGASLDAISVGGESLFRSGIGPLLPGVEHAPPPDPGRCVLEPSGDCASCGLRCARYIEYILEKERDVAAVIAEPFRCTAVNVPPQGYWQAVREACDRHGTLLIFDETAICLGRAGTFYAFQHFGVRPDIVTLGKGLGGGVFPMAAMLCREEFNVAKSIALGHYTHEKSPVGSAAALAAIAVIEEEGLLERSVNLGASTLARLKTMAEERTLVREARGIGLALALELAPNAEEAAEEILFDCLSAGLSFKISQGTILTLTPPLNITDDEMNEALDIIEAALNRAETARKTG